MRFHFKLRTSSLNHCHFFFVAFETEFNKFLEMNVILRESTAGHRNEFNFMITNALLSKRNHESSETMESQS